MRPIARIALIAGKGDHVRVEPLLRDHLLALDDFLDGEQLVAHGGGLLVGLGGRRQSHFTLQTGDDLIGVLHALLDAADHRQGGYGRRGAGPGGGPAVLKEVR